MPLFFIFGANTFSATMYVYVRNLPASMCTLRSQFLSAALSQSIRLLGTYSAGVFMADFGKRVTTFFDDLVSMTKVFHVPPCAEPVNLRIREIAFLPMPSEPCSSHFLRPDEPILVWMRVTLNCKHDQVRCGSRCKTSYLVCAREVICILCDRHVPLEPCLRFGGVFNSFFNRRFAHFLCIRRVQNLCRVTVTIVVSLVLLPCGSHTGRVHGFRARLRLFCNRVCYAYDNARSTKDLAPYQLVLLREAPILPSFVQRVLVLYLHCLNLDQA